MSLRVSLRVGALLLALWLLGGGANDARAESIEYLHVEANVGGSSGGHVALRFGDRVFDFQHGALHTLRLRRGTTDDFLYQTTVLGNRTVHAARIEVAPEVYERLLERFNGRYLVSRRNLAVLASLRDDRVWLARLAEPRRAAGGGARFSWREAGLAGFEAFPGEASASERSARLVELRARVARRHGAGFVAERLAQREAALAGLVYDAGAEVPDVSADRLPAASYAFSERARDLSLWILALRVLDEARPLRPEALATPDPGIAALRPAERRAMARYARALEDALVARVASGRPDGGRALLVGLARLQAVAESLRQGRWLLLDDSGGRAATSPSEPQPYLDELASWTAERFALARERFAAARSRGETSYGDVEAAGRRHLAARRAAARHGAPPLLPDTVATPLPADAWLPLPALPPAAARAAARRAQERETRYGDELRERFAYRLVTHNCVSELFATLEAELGREGMRAAFGGTGRIEGPLDFIPFASFAAVRRTWNVAAVRELPSWRQRRLAEMYAAENDALVFLRESNTLTSTIYRRHDGDAFFLFFSDDAPWLRPVFGALNLAAGLGQTTLGVLRSPFDRARTLRSGLDGILYSLPELAFVDIRKGTMRYGPEAELALRDAP